MEIEGRALDGDSPETEPASDLLGHAPLAHEIATAIATWPGKQPFAIGICGPWGCGKSTVLNFVERELGALGCEATT